MALVPKEKAVYDLQRYLPFIRGATLNAWETWKSIPVDIRVKMCSRTRASAVHNFLVAEAAKLIPTAKIFDFSKLKIFYMGNYAVRFKKFDDELKSSNQPSKQVLNFRGQSQLPGIDSLCNLEAGYTLDPLEQEIQDVYVVCPNGNRRYWELGIHDSNIEIIGSDIFDEEVEDYEDKKTILKPKKEQHEEKKSIFKPKKDKNNVVPIRVTNDEERDN